MLTKDKAKPRNRFALRIRGNAPFWLMLTPSMLLLLAFAYIPMIGIMIAFKDYNYHGGILFSPWSGLKNFEFLLHSNKLTLLVGNTVLYNVLFIITGTIASVVIAIMISEIGGRAFKKITQSMIFLPNFMSWVIVGALLYNIFNVNYGIFNTALRAVGASKIDIYSEPEAWYFLLPLFKIWKDAGFGSVIYFAAIMGIEQDMYESAKLDGANLFQEIKHITLPMLIPTIVILTLLNLGYILRGDFNMFYQLVGTNGLLFNTTDIIDTYVFRALVHNNDIGLASAAAFIQSVFCFLFIILVNRIVKWVQPDYSLF